MTFNVRMESQSANATTDMTFCPHPNRVLIILTGSIGDITRGCCVLPLLRQLNPSMEIGWLVDSRWRSLLEFHPLINRIYEFNRSLGLRGALQAIRAIRKDEFDIALDLQRTAKSGLFALFSGVKRRIGFHPQNAKEGNWLCQNEWIPLVDETQSKVYHYQQFAFILDKEGTLSRHSQVDFGFPRKVFENSCPQPIQSIKDGLIGVLLGSRWESKDWFVDGYVKLIVELLEKHNDSVVLLGDKSKQREAESIQQALNSGADHDARVLNLVGKTSLPELAATIERCRVVVGPDSGPGHVSRALDVPYVSLFGPTDPRRVAPFEYEDLVATSSVGCRPCKRRICPGLDRLCMKLIRPESVIELVDRALLRSKQEAR